MEKPEFSCTPLSKLNLDDIEKVVKGAYHKEDGPGRLPRKPRGTFNREKASAGSQRERTVPANVER